MIAAHSIHHENTAWLLLDIRWHALCLELVNVIDNAPIESFFGHFKTECYDLKKYKTFEELVADIDDYIYFYNNERFQERNYGLAPLEMRNKAVA